MAVSDGSGALAMALAELEAAREGPYYDEEADAQSRQDYYLGIDPDASTEALIAGLADLLARTHQRQPEYKPYLHLYPFVDLQPDGQLRSIYTGEAYTPERMITEDAETDRRRQEFVAQRLLGPGAMGEETLLALQAEIEEALPFNCEHVVPQSWFRHREPMRGDLHHLFTCERKCNEFRASYAFFDFPDFLQGVRTGCGKRDEDENRFEPHLGKGEVARATLYFLVRYPGRLDPAKSGLDVDRLPVLFRWHDAFPVSEYERRRNAAIHEKQGDRNPFIDHPEWVGRVAPALSPD